MPSAMKHDREPEKSGCTDARLARVGGVQAEMDGSQSKGRDGVNRTWKLREAAAGGNLERVQQELSHAIDINDGGGTGWTALHKACERGRGEVVRLLLESGAIPDLTTKTAADTALHLAAANGHVDVCNELVKAGADVHAMNKIGWTPLHAAMHADNLDAARMLTRVGAQASHANAKGVAANMLAHRSDPHQVEAIIEASKHTLVAAVEDREAHDYQAIRESRVAAANRDTDLRLSERRQLQAETEQLKRERAQERAERELELRFSLDASVRKYADVLDPGLDYHNLTPADVPNCHIASQVRAHRCVTVESLL